MPWELVAGGIVAIVAGAVGWLSSEASSWIRLRRDDRAAVGQLLVFLAEMRHQLTVMPQYIRTVSQKWPLSHQDIQIIRPFFDRIMSEPDDAGKRYDQAVQLLAGRQPSLAFAMQSKNRLPAFLREWRRLMQDDPIAVTHLDKMEDCLNKLILPQLDRTIKALARKHGILTWIAYRNRIRSWKDTEYMQREVETLLNEMTRCVEGLD